MHTLRSIWFASLVLLVFLTAGCASSSEPLPSADYSGMSAYEAVLAEAEARGIQLTAEEEATAAANAKQDLLELEKTDEAGQYTLEDLTESYRYSMLFDQLSEIFVPKTGIKEADLRSWYKERYAALEKAYADNPGVFKNLQEQYDLYGGVPPLIVPEGYVRVRQILVEDRATAEDVLSQLEAGADFDEMMERYNIDEGMKAEPYRSFGYLIGPYEATRDYLSEMKEAALALTEVGQISGVVESSAGYHIIRLEEKLTAGSVSYASVRDSIFTMLDANEREKTFNAMVENWIE